MRREGHAWKWAAAALAIALLPLAISCASPDETAQNAAAHDETVPDVVFTEFTREEVEGGIVVFVAKAQRAEYFQDRGELIVYGLSFEDRGKDGSAPQAIGKADKAVYHEDTGDAEFSGSIGIRSIAEDVDFTTERLRYIASSQTLEGGPGDEVSVSVGNKLFMRGAGLFADIQGKSFSLRDGVRGTISTDTATSRPKGE